MLLWSPIRGTQNFVTTPHSLVVRAEKVKVGYIKRFIFFMIGTHRGLLLCNINFVPLGQFFWWREIFVMPYTKYKMPPLVGNNNMQ